jgi:ubiquitin C-terminal hydrolase
MTPKILVIHFERVAIGPQGAIKDCTTFRFEEALSLKRFTRHIEQSSWYELTGIIAQFGSLNQGHYATFFLIGPKWWIFNDSVVRKVSTTAVFAENFTDPSSRQTGHILVYTLT